MPDATTCLPTKSEWTKLEKCKIPLKAWDVAQLGNPKPGYTELEDAIVWKRKKSKIKAWTCEKPWNGDQWKLPRLQNSQVHTNQGDRCRSEVELDVSEFQTRFTLIAHSIINFTGYWLMQSVQGLSAGGFTVRSACQTALLHLNPLPNAICQIRLPFRIRPLASM